jgi:hypothetical protein
LRGIVLLAGCGSEGCLIIQHVNPAVAIDIGTALGRFLEKCCGEGLQV